MGEVYGNQPRVKITEIKRLDLCTCMLRFYIVYWNDLINLKPEGIDESIQSSAISFAFYGSLTTENQNELKADDLVVEIGETSSGNLNISWKLKQILGITVIDNLFCFHCNCLDCVRCSDLVKTIRFSCIRKTNRLTGTIRPRLPIAISTERINGI